MELEIYSPSDGQSIQAIDFNYEVLKVELEQGLKKYENLVYSDNTIKEAKTDRATLNKLRKALEDKRKEMKKLYLEPYEAFEEKIKDLVAMVDAPMLAIDAQVKNYEQIKKDEKLESIKSFYLDKVGDLEKLVPFDRIYNTKWLNATYKEADVHNEIDDLFVKVDADLAVIDELKSKYETQIKTIYLKSYDLTAALQEKKNLEDQAEKQAEYKRIQAEKAAEQKRLQEEREAKAKAEKEAREQRHQQYQQETPEPIVTQQPASSEAYQAQEAELPKIEPAAPIEEQLHMLDFRVWGTLNQLKALQQFLRDNEIKFGRVPENEERKVS